MSPHGSKIWEVIRYLANRILSDGQRKRIKNVITAIREVPIKVLGVNRIIQEQKEEINRLKSRMTILDGKFNIALYGMPRAEEEYRASPMLNGLINPSSLLTRKSYEGVQFDSVQKWQIFNEDLSFLKLAVPPNNQQTTILFTGLGIQSLLSEMISNFTGTEKLFLNDTNPSLFREIEDVFKPRFPSLEYESLCTDPLTAIRALSEVRFSFIGCFYRFQRLAPSEQICFLQLTVDCLEKGGLLLIILPNVLNSEVRDDLYWSDPLSLRLFSLTMIRDTLMSYPGTLEISEDSGLALRILFRKS